MHCPFSVPGIQRNQGHGESWKKNSFFAAVTPGSSQPYLTSITNLANSTVATAPARLWTRQLLGNTPSLPFPSASHSQPNFTSAIPCVSIKNFADTKWLTPQKPPKPYYSLLSLNARLPPLPGTPLIHRDHRTPSRVMKACGYGCGLQSPLTWM